MNVSWRTALTRRSGRGARRRGRGELLAAGGGGARDAAGRHHTVAITHSGAQHAFQQRIEMGGEAWQRSGTFK